MVQKQILASDTAYKKYIIMNFLNSHIYYKLIRKQGLEIIIKVLIVIK